MTNLFRWQPGRQGTGYFKMLLARCPWPIAFDVWLLHYPVGAFVPPHRDAVARGLRHHRVNVVLWNAERGGTFWYDGLRFQFSRRSRRTFYYFRPDVEEHEVTRVTQGTRVVLSIGWTTQEPRPCP